MPYADNNSLPDAIKNALPDAAMTIWRNAFNSAFEKSEDEENAIKIAWGAVKNAGYKKTDSGKWEKTAGQQNFSASFMAEIFSTGTWNGDKYTLDDLHEMVRAFGALRTVVKPMIKLGHNESQALKDGKFALGWATDLFVKGDKLVAKFEQVPDILAKAIKNGLYKRVSSEIYWNYRHAGKTFKRVLGAVSFLGAEMPAVTNLADLDAYFTQSTDNDSGSFASVRAYALDKDFTSKGGPTMADDKITKADLDAEKARADKAEQKLQEYRDKEQVKRKYSQRATFKDACEKAVKAGWMEPAIRDLLVDADKHHYTGDASELLIPASVIVKVFTSKSEKFQETGKHKSQKGNITADSAADEVDERVREYRGKNADVSYADALAIVLDADEVLARAYCAGAEYTDED